jgi:hypothetical protein
MQTPNVLGQPEYPNLPQCKNDSVGSISRDGSLVGWLAGIMDGEGCMGIHGIRTKQKNKLGQMRMFVRNTSPHMIQRISEILVLWYIPFHYNYEKRENGERESLKIVVTGLRSIQKLLLKLLPHLTAKKEEAMVALSYLEWRLGIPLHTRNSKDVAEINRRRDETRDKLFALKRKRFGLQRLPRRASMVLDLTNLEVVV